MTDSDEGKPVSNGIIINLKFGKFTDKAKGDFVWVETWGKNVITREEWKRLGEPDEMEVVLPEMAVESPTKDRSETA